MQLGLERKCYGYFCKATKNMNLIGISSQVILDRGSMTLIIGDAFIVS